MSGFFTKDTAVLDVTSRTVCAMVGVKQAQSVFGIVASEENSHSGFENGEWLDIADTERAAVAALKAATEKSQTRVKTLFIGVPGEFLAIKTRRVCVTLDRSRRVIDADIDYLIKKGANFPHNGFSVINSSAIYYSVDTSDKLYSDVRGLTASKVEGYVSYLLCEDVFTDLIDKTAAECGFKEVRYVASQWAQGIALLEKEQRDNPYVLIDIGYISSTVAVGRGEGLLDVKSFSLGGGHISADIYEALEVPFELAEEAKELCDLNLNYSDNAVLVSDGSHVVYAADTCEIVRAELDSFAQILSDILAEEEAAVPEYAPIYLTGEGIASMRGAKKYLSEALGKSIEIVTPILPGYVRPEDSSKIALLTVADTLNKEGAKGVIKRIFSGGKR